MTNIIKFSLSNFRYIRNYLSMDTSKIYMHTMVFAHMVYCITSWSQAGETAIRPLGKKPSQYHHCPILSKYNLFNLDNLRKYSDVCLVFKIIHDLAPPPLKDFIMLCADHNTKFTRASTRGDCVTPMHRTKFGQSSFSNKAISLWNSLLLDIKNNCNLQAFTSQVKAWIGECV